MRRSSRRRTRAACAALRRLGIVVASLIALVVVAVAIFMAVFNVHVGRGIGDRTYVPATTQELRGDYRLGIGSLELDLSQVQLPPGETHLTTSVDVGDLQVILPPGVALRGTESPAGNVNILGTEEDGWNADVDLARPATACWSSWRTSARGTSASSGPPYDDAGCRCARSRRARDG